MTTHFLQDGLGSTTGLTDDEGSMTDTYTYDVFGATRSHSGSSANPWLFTGELNDPAVRALLPARPLLRPGAGTVPVRAPAALPGRCAPGTHRS